MTSLIRARPNHLNGAITKVRDVLCPDSKRRVFLLHTPVVHEMDLRGVRGKMTVNGFVVSGIIVRVGQDYEFHPSSDSINADCAFNL
jgi:hypothetical protein